MSQTRILCETCRRPQCYCTCKPPACSGTVEGVVGRDLIDNLILKLLNAYLKMSPDQYTVADRDTLQTIWRHPCGQDVLNRAARLYDIERMRIGKRCDMCYDASERDKAHCALCGGTGFIANDKVSGPEPAAATPARTSARRKAARNDGVSLKAINYACAEFVVNPRVEPIGLL